MRRVAILLIVLMMLATGASASGVLMGPQFYGEDTYEQLEDAMFINDTHMLLVGFVGPSAMWENISAWAMLVDPFAEEVVWKHTVKGELARFVSAAKIGETLYLGLRSDGASNVVLLAENGEETGRVGVDGELAGVLSTREGLLVYGEMSDAPWAAMLDAEGSLQWQYVGKASGGYVRMDAAAETSDGYLIGGYAADQGILIELDQQGNEVSRMAGAELGMIDIIARIVLDGNRILLSGGYYENLSEATEGIVCCIGPDGELLWEMADERGTSASLQDMYVHPSGSGYTLCGTYQAGPEMTDVSPIWLITLDREGKAVREWFADLEEDTTPTRLLEDMRGCLWVAGTVHFDEYSQSSWQYHANGGRDAFLAELNTWMMPID